MVPSLGRQARWRSRLLNLNQTGAALFPTCELAAAFNLAAMAARTSSFVFPFGLSFSSPSSTGDEVTNKSRSLRAATSLSAAKERPWWMSGCSLRLGGIRLRSIFKVVFLRRNCTNGLVLGLGLLVGLGATPHCVARNLILCSVAMDLRNWKLELITTCLVIAVSKWESNAKTLWFVFFILLMQSLLSKVRALNGIYVDLKDVVSDEIPNVSLPKIWKRKSVCFIRFLFLSHVVCTCTFFNVHSETWWEPHVSGLRFIFSALNILVFLVRFGMRHSTFCDFDD